ncbi:hypothetical protein [Anaeroselena agilis]|uniref:Uncharacterized protein n=1 Tax=Anaeroselena agilis TaxID=3063788 RepID=A0ABU3NZ58_9FIRM|nr:hypothetical protein [Selenomonadales bacterium 4137-cl]
MAEEQRHRHIDKDAIRHVGGVNDTLGGVDPDIDETLMRLSGGP